MYKKVIRPILFLIPPEIIHRIIVTALRVIHYIPGSRMLLRAFCAVRHPSLEREVFGIRFQNPVGIAAGFDKNAEVYKELLSLGFGFPEIGTVTPKAQPGNPRPRLFRLPEDNALINRMGFNNQGMENAVRNLRHRRPHQIIGGNLGKNTQTRNEDAPADYLRLFRNLYQYVDYFIINVSCPNVSAGGMSVGTDPVALSRLITRLRKLTDKKMIVKLTPNVTDITVPARAAVESGADALSLINTLLGMRINIRTGEPVITHVTGGVSGPAVLPVGLAAVWRVRAALPEIPIIGIGGIDSGETALEYLYAGANAVEVGAAALFEPTAPLRVARELDDLLDERPELADKLAKGETWR